jgi:hypothetical protein
MTSMTYMIKTAPIYVSEQERLASADRGSLVNMGCEDIRKVQVKHPIPISRERYEEWVRYALRFTNVSLLFRDTNLE